MEEMNLSISDASGLSGQYDSLLRPRSIEELMQGLADASVSGQPLTIFGAGTGLSGAAVPSGGTLLRLDRLERTSEIDSSDSESTIRVSAHLSLADIARATNLESLFYPPDPTEPSASIGGTIATNAAGARSFRYGSTRSWVEGLELILADGRSLHLARGSTTASDGMLRLTPMQGDPIDVPIRPVSRPDVSKISAGYPLTDDIDAVDLFVGSEGTLGVTTGATLRLLPLPERLLSILIFFDTRERMLQAVAELRRLSELDRWTDGRPQRERRPDHQISVRTIEYVGPRSLDHVRNRVPFAIPEADGGALWIEQDCCCHEIDGEKSPLIDELMRFIEDATPLHDETIFGLDERTSDAIRRFRHEVPLAAHRYVEQFGTRKVGTDIVVPENRLDELFACYDERLRESGLEAMIWGHIGNAHLHVNLLPENDRDRERAQHFHDGAVTDAVALGGTLSAEHGIGKLKRSLFRRTISDQDLQAMLAVKRVLDPENLLGSGTIF